MPFLVPPNGNGEDEHGGTEDTENGKGQETYYDDTT